MRTFREQFVDAGRAEGPCDGGAHREGPRELCQSPQGSGCRTERPRTNVADVGRGVLPVGPHAYPVVAEARLQAYRIQIDLLQREYGKRGLRGVRREERASEPEVLPGSPRPHRPRRKGTPAAVAGQDLAAHRLALVERTQNVRGLDLPVLVPGVPRVDLDALEGPGRPEHTAQPGRCALHLHANPGLVTSHEAAGDAVVVAVVAEGRAGMAPVVHPRCSAGNLPDIRVRVLQESDRGRQVAAAATREFKANGNVTRQTLREIQASAHGVADALSLKSERTRQRARQMVRHRWGHVVADDVDDAPQGVASVQNRTRPADDLDAARRRCVDRRGVVWTARKFVADPFSVLEHQDTVSAEPPDHRVRRARPHAAHRQSRLGGERFRQGAGQTTLKLLPREYAGRAQHFVRRARDRGSRDDEVRQGDGIGFHLHDHDLFRRRIHFQRDRTVAQAFDAHRVDAPARHGKVERAVAMRDRPTPRRSDGDHGAGERLV